MKFMSTAVTAEMINQCKKAINNRGGLNGSEDCADENGAM